MTCQPVHPLPAWTLLQRSAALLLPVPGHSRADTQILCSTTSRGAFATQLHGMPSAFQEPFHLEHPKGSSDQCLRRAVQPSSHHGASGRHPVTHTNLRRAFAEACQKLQRPFPQQPRSRQAGAGATKTLSQPLPHMSTSHPSEPASTL